jgi:uncharacterized protein (TIGR00369 family)
MRGSCEARGPGILLRSFPVSNRADVVSLINNAIGFSPYNAALGLRAEAVSKEGLTVVLPYRPELVGNPETGVLHGGVITGLVDASCGLSVFIELKKAVRIATLDLRIDYLKPATPPKDVRARAQCYKLTRQVAFVRAIAFHDDVGDPIASAAGTFIIFDDQESTIGRAVSGS